jgi:hypothetical protein
MPEFSDLNCKIYVETPMERGELARQVGVLIKGEVERFTVMSACGELDVQRNEEFDEERRAEFPDGFLYFRYVVEVYSSPGNEAQCRHVVAKIVGYLWSNDIPCVAACDYEEELPNRGGYKSPAVPWVK